MSKRQRKALRAVAAFLILSFAQVGIRLSHAAENSSAALLPIPQQLIVARLERVRGAAITVNGGGVTGGATITTASTIETGADTVATVNLGSLGTLDIAPNTRLELTYDDQGNVKVKLISGCAVLRTKKGNGEITTEAGASTGQNKNKGILDVCIPPGGGNPIVNQGAAAAATSSGAAAGAAAGGGGLWGIGTAAVVSIIAGAGGAVIIAAAATHGGQGNTSGGTSL
ncbi:MAG TPA: hypothetical protein VE135_26710 [Pyrinomonadaceae bacterium]|nr:hypothetical protein [Pyrinomonadaceae bacterium]